VGTDKVTFAKSDEGVVEPEEYVLRRVHRNFCTPDLEAPFGWEAFYPSRNDIYGISVFRESFCSVCELLMAARQSPEEYLVTRLRVEDILRLNMQVVSSPDPDPSQPRGHALIPELRHLSNKSARRNLREPARALADIANINGVLNR